VGLEAAAKQTPPAGPSAGDAPPLPKSRTLAAQSVSVRLQPLARRLEELALLATINDWPHIERLWLDLLPDLRGTVMDLGVLEDVYGADLRHVRLQDRTLAMHLEALTGILKELSACLAAEKPLDLSDVLERRLAPWIKELEAFLLQLK
jgi:hypothetical protein